MKTTNRRNPNKYERVVYYLDLMLFIVVFFINYDLTGMNDLKIAFN